LLSDRLRGTSGLLFGEYRERVPGVYAARGSAAPGTKGKNAWRYNWTPIVVVACCVNERGYNVHFFCGVCDKRPTLQCGEVRFVTVGVCLKFFMLVPLEVCKIALLGCKVMLLVILLTWLNDLVSSPNIVRVIKSRRVRWAGHVARIGEEERRIQGFGGET